MPELESAGSLPLALLAVAILCVAANVMGSLLVRPSLTGRWRWIDATLVRMTIGLNLITLIGIVLGQAGLFDHGRSIWMLGGLTFLGFLRGKWWRLRGGVKGPQSAVTEVSKLRKKEGRPAQRRTQGIVNPAGVNEKTAVGANQGVFLWGLLIVGAVITLGPALCYPTGWDELVYHTVLPQRWLIQGSPAFYPDIPYSGFPSFGEIQFWLVAPIENVIAPRLIAWGCWILGLAAMHRLLRRTLSGATATVMTLALASNDTMLLISANSYVESILLLDVAVLLLASRLPGLRNSESRNNGSRPWTQAAIFGIIAGGAAAVKLTGGSVLIIPAMWYAGSIYFAGSRWRTAIAHFAMYVLIAVSVSVPFYVRPLLATGNPFYPYFCDWFTSDAAQLEMSRYHHVLGGFFFGVHGLPGFVSAPLLMAFRSDNYDGEFGWQLLVFVLLAVIGVASAGRRRLQKSLLWPFSVAMSSYVFWFMTAQQARFAVSFILGLVLLAGLGIRVVPRHARLWVLLTLTATTLFSIPWRRMDYYFASWLTVTGRMSRTDYVHNLTDQVHLPLVQAVHTLTAPDAKIMLLYEHRGFYLSRNYVIGTPLFQERPFTPPEQFANSDAVRRVLRQQNITHVITAKAIPGPDQAPGFIERQQPLLRAIEQCVSQKQLVPRWESNEYVLFEVAE